MPYQKPKTLIASSLDLEDPILLTRPLTFNLGNGRFVGEMANVIQYQSYFNIKHTFYHSQVFVKTNGNDSLNHTFPIMEITPTQTSYQYDIGRVIIHIVHQGADNSTQIQLMELVGTKQDGSTSSSTHLEANGISTDSTNQTLSANVIDAEGDIHNFGYFLSGEDASGDNVVKRTYEYSLNDYLKSSSSTAGNPVKIGLKFNQAPAAGSIFKIESYCEIKKARFERYLDQQTIS